MAFAALIFLPVEPLVADVELSSWSSLDRASLVPLTVEVLAFTALGTSALVVVTFDFCCLEMLGSLPTC